MPDTSLTGKVAVVTGSSRAGGIGRAICHALGGKGASVVVSDVGRPLSLVPDYPIAATEALDEAVEELRAAGIDAIGVQCDVTKPDEVTALVAAAVDRFGRLDIFVNNAGIATESVELVDVSERGFTQTLEVNLKGTFLGVQAAARQLIAQGSGGRIINIASQAGKTGWPLLSAYSASKFGVIGLTQVAAKELGRHAITVNAVCPGTVNTPLNDTNDGIWSMYGRYFQMTADAVRAATLEQIPLGRFQEPEDVADLVVFLASDQGSYITGAAINTTGGQEMH